MAVTGIEFRTEPFEGGRSFGAAGPYEQITGTIFFSVDASHPRNEVITDLGLVPPDEDGRVSFSADFCMLRPRDPARGNRRLLLDVPNRGNRVALRSFDVDPVPVSPGEVVAGDGWLLRRGYTVAWCGWQHDVPDAPGLMRISAPEALQDGRPIAGKVCCRFEPAETTNVLQLSHGGHVPYAVADLDQTGATLSVREYPDAPARVVSRDEWRFARLEGRDIIPDRGHVQHPAGFLPGKFYELTYTARGATPTGLGLAATRDLASFLRYAPEADGNPCAGQLDFVYAYGASQSGGLLRALLYLGLHEDEQGRPAFDGLLPHIAGAFRGEFNWRFGQPSYFGPRSLAYVFPFTDAEQVEPETGRADGLQRRALERDNAPKVIYTNTSSEYWYLYGALSHSAPDGSGDVPLPDNVRIYHFAGTQHGGARFPLTNSAPEPAGGPMAAYPFNTVDHRPLLRAALANLDRWVSEGVEPPPSRYSRVADGSLVERESLRDRVDRIPGLSLPEHLPSLGRLDYGPEMSEWRQTEVPPAMGPSYAMLVPAIDDDGNELGGIRLPDVTVPIATHAGWNRRHPEIGDAGQGLALSGSTVPFPRTAAERAWSGDPRASIEERYVSREAYLERVRAAANTLVQERYLLDEDIEPVLDSGAQRYDAFTRA